MSEVLEFNRNYPIENLKEWKNNPRKNDKAVDKLSELISNYGFINPIVIDQNGIIRAGHTRIKATRKMGLTNVPVMIVKFKDESEAIGYAISDNKSSEWANWDNDLLKQDLEVLKINLDLKFSGFSESELSKIMGSEEIEEKEIIRENKFNVQIGDIWQLGSHKIMCGNSLNQEEVIKLCAETKVNMVLTDPPYNVDYSEKNKFLNSISPGNRNQTPIENDKIEDFKLFLETYFKNISFADYNTVYMFIGEKELANAINAIKDAGLYYSQDLKWVKNNHVLGRLDYNPKSENILYGWKGKHEFYGGFQTDVLFFDKPIKSLEHPTMKPVELLIELLKHGSRENGIVYDGFLGSGSTLIACEKTDRICYGLEIDPIYCSVIIERFENLTGKKAIKVGGKDE